MIQTNKNKPPNDLVHYRKRMRFTQEQVARLLGYKTRDALSRMENGGSLPSLDIALQLAALYRVPVDFLFREKYIAFRKRLRDLEETISSPRQGLLNLTLS